MLSLSSHQTATCSCHKTADKIVEYALNNNHPLTHIKRVCSTCNWGDLIKENEWEGITSWASLGR